MASHPIYQFYAELDEFKPKIWRRFQTQNDITVTKLGYIVQVLFEMTASHLMAVEVPRCENVARACAKDNHPLNSEYIDKHLKIDGVFITDCYEFINQNFESYDVPHLKQKEIRNVKLCHVIESVGDVVRVNYDFGDDWYVSLTLEKIFEDAELAGSDLPRVMEGENFGIVENVGGLWGLEDLVKAFKSKRGAEYKQFSDWLGVKEFDITAFDIDDMNFQVKKIPRIYKQCYEDRLRPTQQSVDLIERKYLKEK